VFIGTLTILNITLVLTCYYYTDEVLNFLGLNEKKYIRPFMTSPLKKNPYTGDNGINKIPDTILIIYK
jgi:hypothetical protein